MEGAQTDDARPPSLRIVEEVARLSDRQPTDLEPLYRYVDVDALDALFSSSTAPSGAEVQFTYAGEYEVSVDGDGAVSIAPR